jgi:hypothetical protein
MVMFARRAENSRREVAGYIIVTKFSPPGQTSLMIALGLVPEWVLPYIKYGLRSLA